MPAWFVAGLPARKPDRIRLGRLLQLGDDLQDLCEDLNRGSATLFTRAAFAGTPLDAPVTQLLHLSERVSDRIDLFPSGSPVLKGLLKMSWRSIIVGAIANAHRFFSPGFLREAERCSPFRFEFLRERQQRLTSQCGLFASLFDALIDDRVCYSLSRHWRESE